MEFSIYIWNFFFFCEKRNASTPLGIEPRTFRLPVESQVDKVDMVEFGYHGEWYTLLIIDIIYWNDLEKFVNMNDYRKKD